jgi:hypothetical protein
MVLTAADWEAEFERRQEARKLELKEENKEKLEAEVERRSTLAAVFDITFQKLSIKAKDPDYSGIVKKSIEVTAQIPTEAGFAR